MSVASSLTSEQEGVLECAICFDEIVQPVELPCACRVSYCLYCWDRSLAQSFAACGHARCASCRQPVRVDYVAETRRLVFSRETMLQATENFDQEYRTRQQNRLLEQTQPTLIQNLEHFGAEHPELAVALAEGVRPMIVTLEALSDGPRCVCGSELERLSSRDRFRQFMERRTSHAPGTEAFESSFQHAWARTAYTCFTCDICHKVVSKACCIWSCQRGNQTMLHPKALDVCEPCLLQHACGEEVPDSLAVGLGAYGSSDQAADAGGEECAEQLLQQDQDADQADEEDQDFDQEDWAAEQQQGLVAQQAQEAEAAADWAEDWAEEEDSTAAERPAQRPRLWHGGHG